MESEENKTFLQSPSMAWSSEKCWEEKMLQVFRCGHAFETVLTYLNFKDCKELSLCSKLLNDVVRRSKTYSKSASITVDKESWTLLSRTTYGWKNARVELSCLPQESYLTIQSILKTVTFLKVQLTIDPMEKLLEKKLNFHLTNILINAAVLKSLWLDLSMMQWILHDTFSNVRVQDCLMKLRELHFVMVADDHERKLAKIDIADEDSDETDDEGPFPRNMFQISLIRMALQTFSFVVQNDPRQKDVNFNAFVPNIMKHSHKTLVDVTISLDGWTTKATESILFPSMKSLNIKVANLDFGGCKDVGKIIRNQPLLNRLCISECTFSRNILESVAARSAKLKILHLQSKMWSPSISSRDFYFLSSLTNLKDFKLDSESLKLSLVTILKHLPNQLETITINGIHENYCGNDDEEDKTILKIAELTKFRNLEELSLLGCENAINNDILDHMYYHMKQLTALEFSLCPNVTDEGLTGVRQDVFMGVSIQNLLGLKKLTIRCCSQISSNSLQKVLKFSHLKSLDISGIKISEEAALEIVSSNPCLETFFATFDCSQDVHVDRNPFFKYSMNDRIRDANPRTQTVKISSFRSSMETFCNEV